jgi:hypothetical protein
MEERVRLHPPMAKHYRVPQSLVIEATKVNPRKQLEEKP